MTEHLYFLIIHYTLIHYFYNFATENNKLNNQSTKADNELPNNRNN